MFLFEAGRRGEKKKEVRISVLLACFFFYFSNAHRKRKQVILNTQKLNNYLCSLRQCYHIRCIFSLSVSGRDQ